MAQKTDKGFQLNYWKLSYRRKFFRTLWLTPICVIVLLLLYAANPQEWYLGVLVLVFIVNIIQLAYTYTKWKAEERAAAQNPQSTSNDIIYRP